MACQKGTWLPKAFGAVIYGQRLPPWCTPLVRPNCGTITIRALGLPHTHMIHTCEHTRITRSIYLVSRLQQDRRVQPRVLKITLLIHLDSHVDTPVRFICSNCSKTKQAVSLSKAVSFTLFTFYVTLLYGALHPSCDSNACRQSELWPGSVKPS